MEWPIALNQITSVHLDLQLVVLAEVVLVVV